jgi:putative endonuclease
MPDPRHQLGRDAEAAVADWLISQGWRVIARRVRSTAGSEVDLVALDPAGTLVGVEIRARRTGRAGTGAESVDARKTARMGRTLVAVAAGGTTQHRGLRLDLVTITQDPGAPRWWRLRRAPDIGAR